MELASINLALSHNQLLIRKIMSASKYLFASAVKLSVRKALSDLRTRY